MSLIILKHLNPSADLLPRSSGWYWGEAVARRTVDVLQKSQQPTHVKNTCTSAINRAAINPLLG